MVSKQQNGAELNISPVLFMTVDGEPMTFFLRPGPVKLKLQPLITAGAGVLCNVQQPGAILLMEPEERGSISESTTHWFVSTQYILDCIEKNEQLNLEDYRLNPEVVPRQSPRRSNKKEISTGLIGSGRLSYSAEDDAAILTFVSQHKSDTGGNRLWKEMEKQSVTSHSWQSMKSRYKTRLANSEVVKVATTGEDTKAAEGKTKVKENEETEIQKTSSPEDPASAQTHLTGNDPTQVIRDQSVPYTVQAETSIPAQEEVQHVDPQTDIQPPESQLGETVEKSNAPHPEGPCLEPQTHGLLVAAQSAEPQTVISPQKKSAPQDSPKYLHDTSSPKKSREMQKVSPKLEQLQRRVTRRQLALEMSPLPELYGKKLRSSSTSPLLPPASPQPSKRTKSASKSTLLVDTVVEEPPPKRPRAESVAGEEEEEEEGGQAAGPETAQAGTESNSTPQKKKEKRKFGILEMAIKEFEDGSESGDDAVPDVETPIEAAATQPTSAEHLLPTSDKPPDAVSTASSPEQVASPHRDAPEAEPLAGDGLPTSGCLGPVAKEADDAASKVHLFIFDSESQEDSQSIIGDRPAAPSKPRAVVNNDDDGGVLSLTQVQLDEDKQRIKDLMSQTNQDLVSVTKALLKTSGDFAAALDHLLNPTSISAPVWNRCDDTLLRSADPGVRQQLREKYGEQDVARRIVFLEVEG
ncbi:telomeric repeat-binding factor 2-interacting protein 1 isoform X1 [Pungitius pungitius]|uniref:telomeric repeat-binding factor 2-interacting protein 1 isoform X1 n=1 Tax=Pungitius pungitius TaxID=134920 RepID=UPI002E11C8F3